MKNKWLTFPSIYDRVSKVVRNRKAECPLSPRHTGDRRFISEIVFRTVFEGEKLEESGRFHQAFCAEVRQRLCEDFSG